MGKETYDGSYVYGKLKYEFPLPSFTINEILDYVEEHCFIDKERFHNPFAIGATHLRKGGDIWAGYGRTPNNNLMGWYITFNAKNQMQGFMIPKSHSKKVMWDKYSNPPYIGYYDGVTYYSKQLKYVRQTSAKKRHDRTDFDVKIDSADFIILGDDELNEIYFKTPHRVVTRWASIDFVKTMAHFRIDGDLINPRHLGLINWPYEKPQGLN